ncbi:MAG: Gfo/Idh/MocA family oxidoreductase [Alphaproteobacteria bacterium]|nr:MAG: Gfo/Idh/MocA family oxidoreductase [Alphaproteobacteria bacterium]
MRIALVGLGDIARKAYLPVLSATAGVELVLISRNAAARDEIGEKYRIGERYPDLGSAPLDTLDAAFVHAATSAHPALVEALLRADVPTYVDKPLAADLATCEALVALAEERRCSLMVGFNRRFAPAYAALLDAPRDLIVMEKNRANLPGEPRTVVFDDFIHVVDTLRALAPGPVLEAVPHRKMVGALLHHVALTLRGDGFLATGIMNRMSGAGEEWLEAMGGGSKIRVEELTDVTQFDGGRRAIPRDNWKPVTWTRGFEQICAAFLHSVRKGEVLSARDALATHQLCETIVQSVEGTA